MQSLHLGETFSNIIKLFLPRDYLNVKVYVNGKRIFSWFGLKWKVDKKSNSIIFNKNKILGEVTITYNYIP